MNHQNLIIDLTEEQLALIQLFIFYLCSQQNYQSSLDEMIRFIFPLKFSKNETKKYGRNTIKLLFSKDFKSYLKENGQKEEFLLLNHSDLESVNFVENLTIVNLFGYQLEIRLEYLPNKREEKRYLSIDLGIKNPVTVVDSMTGNCMILGRDFMSRSHYFEQEISKLVNVYLKNGFTDLNTKRMTRLVNKRDNTLKDILHKMSRYLTNYCSSKEIKKVIVGDFKESPSSPFPFNYFLEQLQRKLKRQHIDFIIHSEEYTSQCPPDSPEISKVYAQKQNRVFRGLYRDGSQLYNADGVGALNILKSYLNSFGNKIEIPLNGIISPIVVTVSD